MVWGGGGMDFSGTAVDVSADDLGPANFADSLAAAQGTRLQAAQPVPAAQNQGEGSEANLDRRAAIAAAAQAHEGDTSMPYTPGHGTCNQF
jgi:hypothetical protein